MPNFDSSYFATTASFGMTTTEIAPTGGNNGGKFSEPTCHESFILRPIFRDLR